MGLPGSKKTWSEARACCEGVSSPIAVVETCRRHGDVASLVRSLGVGRWNAIDDRLGRTAGETLAFRTLPAMSLAGRWSALAVLSANARLIASVAVTQGRALRVMMRWWSSSSDTDDFFSRGPERRRPFDASRNRRKLRTDAR